MKRILVIEDEKTIIDLLKRKLEGEGYEVVLAQDGEEGLQLMKAEHPDLVLLDLIIPKKDGMAVMEDIQKDECLKKIPVIVISNSGQPVELGLISKLGAKDWLVKTEFDLQKLVEKIRNVI